MNRLLQFCFYDGLRVMPETDMDETWSRRREWTRYGTTLLAAGELLEIPEREQRFDREELVDILTRASEATDTR